MMSTLFSFHLLTYHHLLPQVFDEFLVTSKVFGVAGKLAGANVSGFPRLADSIMTCFGAALCLSNPAVAFCIVGREVDGSWTYYPTPSPSSFDTFSLIRTLLNVPVFLVMMLYFNLMISRSATRLNLLREYEVIGAR